MAARDHRAGGGGRRGRQRMRATMSPGGGGHGANLGWLGGDRPPAPVGVSGYAASDLPQVVGAPRPLERLQLEAPDTRVTARGLSRYMELHTSRWADLQVAWVQTRRLKRGLD